MSDETLPPIKGNNFNTYQLVQKYGAVRAKEIIERDYYLDNETGHIWILHELLGSAEKQVEAHIKKTLKNSEDIHLPEEYRLQQKERYHRLTTEPAFREILLQQCRSHHKGLVNEPSRKAFVRERNGDVLYVRGVVTSVFIAHERYGDRWDYVAHFLKTGEAKPWPNHATIERITTFDGRRYRVGSFVTVEEANDAEQKFLFLKSIGAEPTPPIPDEPVPEAPAPVVRRKIKGLSDATTGKQERPFQAVVRFEGRQYNLGRYATKDEAESVKKQFLAIKQGLAPNTGEFDHLKGSELKGFPATLVYEGKQYYLGRFATKTDVEIMRQRFRDMKSKKIADTGEFDHIHGTDLKPYQCVVLYQGKQYNLGRFATKDEVAVARRDFKLMKESGAHHPVYSEIEGKPLKPFVATVTYEGKQYQLGRFNHEEEAEAAKKEFLTRKSVGLLDV